MNVFAEIRKTIGTLGHLRVDVEPLFAEFRNPFIDVKTISI